MNDEQRNYGSIWRRLAYARHNEVKALADKGVRNWNGSVDHQAARLALGDYKLECFAEGLRDKMSAPWFAPAEWDELRLYLLEKHHWSLNCVRRLKSREDFLFALHPELHSLRLTPEQSAPVREWVRNLSVRDEIAPHLAPQTSASPES